METGKMGKEEENRAKSILDGYSSDDSPIDSSIYSSSTKMDLCPGLESRK